MIASATRAALAFCLLTVLPAGAVALPALSSGGFRMGADALWSRGIDGRGQTIVVLDRGFGGLGESIAAGELPSTGLDQVSFDPAYGIEGRDAVGQPTQHGTRIAEAIYDVAPGARMVLVNYNTEEQFREAVDWLVANPVPVVAHANSFLLPPFDGTGPNAQAVDRAAAAGILWVNSAGNFARRHWSGTLGATPVDLPFDVNPGGVLALSVSPFGAAGDRVLLEIQHSEDGSTWSTRSSVEAGSAGALSDVVVSTGGQWRVRLSQVSGSGSLVRVFSRTPGFGGSSVPTGSIPTPGDAAGSLSAGAVRWTGTELAAYSSRGPTQDGRAKPDLVGPTYVTANPAWPGSAGTSAAAAHTAGAAVLLRAKHQVEGLSTDAATVRSTLLTTAADLGDPGPDLLFGAGMVRLDVRAPNISTSVSNEARPLVQGIVIDDGTIDRVSVSVDGVRVRLVRSAQFRARLPALAPGRHRVVVSASDMAGNRATRGAWVRVGR